ncbi:hypothetical protein AURDEDRAFT_156935 [Auricularia subglabra TFB-10046 SS5]|nr:hypothetical protein AURDEDRAFT_156935 [Auricularia subglabra TFB-10046 SS5]
MSKPSGSSRPAPYDRKKRANYPTRNPSTIQLLATLARPENPIAHSDLSKRTDHIAAPSARGHEVRDHGSAARASQWKPRLDANRLAQVPAPDADKVFVKAFIADTADVETRKKIQDGGGLVLNYAAGATHIVSAFPWISGSKAQKQAKKKPSSNVHVVTPAWVMDSFEAGRRKPERDYAVSY